MTVATDLQDAIADVSAAIAGKKTWGRTELEVLRRRLTAAAKEARATARKGDRAAHALDELASGVERGVADLAGLARHARGLAPEVAHG